MAEGDGSEEFILEIQSTEDITSADYLKAVVEKCLRSLNDGQEDHGEIDDLKIEPTVEIVTPEGTPDQERHDSVVNYIDFDEYMVNEVVICESEDEGKSKIKKPPKKRGKQKGRVHTDQQNQLIDSIRNDHMYHDVYQEEPHELYQEASHDLYQEGPLDAQHTPHTFITIIEEADGNIEIVEAEAQSRKGRTKLPNGAQRSPKPKVKSRPTILAHSSPEKRPRNSDMLKKKKEKLPKEPKKPRQPKPPKPARLPKPARPPKEPKPPREPKEGKVRKEKTFNLSTGDKSLYEVVIKKPDVELSVANGEGQDITDPSVQMAIRAAIKENKENLKSTNKTNYSIYDADGNVILPFAPKRYSDALPFWCDDCDFKTGTRQRLKLHKLRKHGGVKQFQCCECSYSAHDAYSVRVHYGNIHCDTKKYKCDECTFACNNQAGLRKHKSKSHGDKKPYICSKCGYQQYNITILKQHIQSVHMGVMPYVCMYCNKRFIDDRRMQLHIKRLHYRLKRFRCAKCSFSAFTKCEVKKHLFSHHIQVLRLDCSQCDYSCKTRQDLVQHVKKVHTKTSSSSSVPKTGKQQSCQFCDFRSSQHKDLASHMKEFHGINKNVRCDECDFVTFDLVLLKKHIKESHNPEALKCKNCNFTTMNWASMKEHKKTHSEKVAFPCKHCNATFRYKMCLTKHEVIKHGRDLNQEPEDDKNTTYEKQWISYDTSSKDTTWEVISDGKSKTLTYVGVNAVTNIELDRLIADTVAGEDYLEGDEPLPSNSLEQTELPTYLCTSCYAVFQDKTVLEWHVRKHDLDDALRRLASSKENIVPHLSESMSEILRSKYLSCTRCGYSDSDEQDLFIHILLDHYECELSGMEGTLLRKMPISVKSEPLEKDEVKFKEKLSLTEAMLSCALCDFVTSSRSLFMNHRKICSGEAQYIVPCEIVISEDFVEGEPVPVDVLNAEGSQTADPVLKVRTRIVQGRRKKQPEEFFKDKSRYKQVRMRKYSSDYLSDDEDDPDAVRKVYKCTECIFVSDRKRVLAKHFINVHINKTPKKLRINNLKNTLLAKLEGRPPPEPMDMANLDDEDSQQMDDPEPDFTTAPCSSSIIEKLEVPQIKQEIPEQDHFENSLDHPFDQNDVSVIEKHEMNILNCENENGFAEASESENHQFSESPIKFSAVKSQLKKKIGKLQSSNKNGSKAINSSRHTGSTTNEKGSSQGKIELFEKLALKRASTVDDFEAQTSKVAQPKIVETSEKKDIPSANVTPVRKSSRSNAGQNPKGLLSVKDIKLLIYGRPKPTEDDDYVPSVKSYSKPQKPKSNSPSKTSKLKKTARNTKQSARSISNIAKINDTQNQTLHLHSSEEDIVDLTQEETVKTPEELKRTLKAPKADRKKEIELKASSPDEEFVCKRCDAKMSSWEALNMHSILAHGYSILLTCSYCCYTATTKHHLRTHIHRCFLLNS